MKYFVTMYIKNMQALSIIPHAFLGLTHTHPDELDSLKDIDIYKYQVGYDSDKPMLIHVKDKWYNNIYPSILDSNFGDEGFWGFGPESMMWKSGKVFENNQYNHESYKIIKDFDDNPYRKTEIRSLSTFWQQNRCVFEVSKEQYEALVESIKVDVKNTLYINKNSQAAITKELKYDFTNNNCTTWALNKLETIGIEVLSNDKGRKEWIPDAPMLDDLKETFMYLRFYNAVFLQFQAVDSNLKSIKGAKAFSKWARMMMDNMYCFALKFDDERNTRVLDKRQESLNAPFEIILWKDNAYRLKQVYRMLREKLETLKSKQVDLKGKFILIYNDKESGNRKIFIDPSSGYMEQDLKYLDLTIPANNFSTSEFYPFIFIPDDEMIARILYHEYDYGTLSPNYTKDTMDFYYAFLEGREIKEHWSEAFHVINKRVKNEYRHA